MILSDQAVVLSYRDRIVAAVFEAILRGSLVKDNGTRKVYLNTVASRGALLLVLSALMEAAPICQAPSGVNVFANAFRDDSKRMLLDFRLRREGKPVLAANIIHVS